MIVVVLTACNSPFSVNSSIHNERSNTKMCITKTKMKKKDFRKQTKIFITKIREMMAMLMMNYVVYDDDVSYVFDVANIDLR